MASCNPNLAILSHRFCILHPSATHLFDREFSENEEKGETDGPGRFETGRGHGQGNLSFNAIVLPDSNAVRYVKRKRVISNDDWTTQSLWGKGGQKVAIDFCIHPIPTLL